MPYVGFETSIELSQTQKETVKKMIGEIISLIPGKTVETTMFNIKGGAFLEKGETADECAFVDVRLRGTAPNEAKDAFVKAFCAKLKSEFGLEPSHVYMNFSEFEVWGSNGGLH